VATTFSITVDIAALPERVWDVIKDVERWPEWTPSVKSVRRLDAGPLAPGSRAVIRQPRLPPAVWKVTDVERYGFSWKTGSPGAWVVARHSVVATANGSRATLALLFTGLLGPLLGRLTQGLNDRYLKLEAAGLKQRSEAGEGAPISPP
jgi:hypothetical protein